MTFFFYFIYFFFYKKTSLDISCESSAKQMIHMKFQDLFSLKNKKNSECRLLQILLGAFRVSHLLSLSKNCITMRNSLDLDQILRNVASNHPECITCMTVTNSIEFDQLLQNVASVQVSYFSGICRISDFWSLTFAWFQAFRFWFFHVYFV